MTNKKTIYLAIDSDILRTLTLLDILKTEHGYVDIEKVKDVSLKKDFNYFNRLYNAILYDEIRPLVVDAVYQESKHSNSLIEFMKKYCYFPNVNAVNYQDKAEKARNLANAYTKPFIYNGEHCDPPMKAVFVADINKYVPTNDCYIMAQATIEHCSLLTGNGKDFIFNQRHEDRYAHERVKGIAQVNILNGYFDEDSPGHYITPKPVMINTLAGILKYDDEFLSIEQNEDKVKADLIL